MSASESSSVTPNQTHSLAFVTLVLVLSLMDRLLPLLRVLLRLLIDVTGGAVTAIA